MIDGTQISCYYIDIIFILYNMTLETPVPPEIMVEAEKSQAKGQVKEILRSQVNKKSYELEDMNDMNKAVVGRSVEKITSLTKEVGDLQEMWNTLDRGKEISEDEKQIIQSYFDSEVEKQAANLRKQMEQAKVDAGDRVPEQAGIDSESNQILEQLSQLVRDEGVKASDVRFMDLQEQLTQAVRKKEMHQKNLSPAEAAVENSQKALAEAQNQADLAHKL